MPVLSRRPWHLLGSRLRHADADLDLVPMIDCIFLILLFFMLCGRISMSDHPEQITVPPGKTARVASAEWPRQVVNIRAASYGNTVSLAGKEYATGDDLRGWSDLRAQLDLIYDHADRYPDPRSTPRSTQRMLPRVIIEIRADSDTAYRTVMELEQVLADTPGRSAVPSERRPFVDLEYTVRDVGR